LFGKIILNKIDLEVDKLFEYNSEKYFNLVNRFETYINKILEENYKESINDILYDFESVYLRRDFIINSTIRDLIDNYKRIALYEFMNNKYFFNDSFDRNNLIDKTTKNINYTVKKNNPEFFKNNYLRSISSASKLYLSYFRFIFKQK